MQKNEEQIGALYAKTMNQTPSPRKRREDYETTADLASGNVPWASDSPEDIAIFSDASSPTQINSYLKGSVAEINELFGKKAMAACAVVHAEADARDGEGPEENGNDGLFLDSGMNNVAASSIVKQPKKTYRLPFQSFFINLLKTDNHEADDDIAAASIAYSASNYAVTIWQNQEDDVSTIAASIGSLMRKSNEMILSRARSSSQPELTATRSGSTILKNSTDDSEDGSSCKKDMNMSVYSSTGLLLHSRWVIATAVLLAFFLLGTCIGLGIALKKIRSRSSTSHMEAGTATTLAPINPQFSAGSPVQTPSPIEHATQPATPMSSRPRLPQNDLLNRISIASPSSLVALSNTKSPQSQAFEWMIADPEYFSYTPDRIIQRWVMATLFFSTSGGLWRVQRLLGGASNTTHNWATYTDECNWYAEDSTNVCNADGMVQAIHLSGNGLGGTLPDEISLLSNWLGE